MIVRPKPVAESADTVTYEKAEMARLFDDLEDLEARAAFVATRAEEKLPAPIVERLCRGESPVKVFRQHRGLSRATLAQQAGLTRSRLAEIEVGRRSASADTLGALAAALDVAPDDLTP